MNEYNLLNYLNNMMISEFVEYEPICDNNEDLIGYEAAILKLTHYIINLKRDILNERMKDHRNEKSEKNHEAIQ